MPYVLALVPTVGVSWLFYVIIKNILEGDRRERIAQAKWESAHRVDTPGIAESGTGTGQSDGP